MGHSLARSLFTVHFIQLRTVIDLKLYLEQLPRELGYPWEGSKQKPLRLIDAMNITVDLPKELCTTWNVSANDASYNNYHIVFFSRTLTISSSSFSGSVMDVDMSNAGIMT